MKVNASARILIEVKDLGTWGDDCTVDQIKKQAVDAVRSRLNRVFHGAAISVVSHADVKIEITE